MLNNLLTNRWFFLLGFFCSLNVVFTAANKGLFWTVVIFIVFAVANGMQFIELSNKQKGE